ncbi:50S ribosomal protein L11 methyltransferase, partial [Aestuariivirga sp.]|uniref:50S ribosomal protein L11 methyltransferase n=1 Tax=Aestuariivirga sp. TaxID=2650926 RepID=UPI0030162506
MTEARFTLTLPALSHDGANDLAWALEENVRLDTMAIAINETDEDKGLWELVLYFGSEAEAEDARGLDELREGLISPMPQQDWVRQSLEGLAPVSAGRFFLHGSHDRNRRRPGGIALEIDAGTAFGTGHHGTTEGCLIALDRILKRRTPCAILDVGCGTGVLAIAAAKATGRPALASDIDPEAVRVTLTNASLNGVKPLIGSFVAAGLSHPRIAGAGRYDLIFANILARPLVALSTGLARALKPGGDLILSGLTLEQMRWIEATYESRGLALAGRITRGNWATLVFTRAQKKKRPGGRTPGRLLVAGS